ncbi:MAG: molybdopterin-dependent oxidoreductase [Chloroflexales bacterium]|nr:molybdopterin-dependent oxidoreductase [Chloroflexales bacterium]
MSSKRTWRLTRRGFLIGAGVTGAGLALGINFGLPAIRLRLVETFEEAGTRPNRIEAPPTAWFEIDADNQIRVFIPKVEMGQGVHTSLAQIAAEELEVGWQQLQVRQATTTLGPYDTRGTSGSMSVATLYLPIREVAATMREMLRSEAAKQLGVPASELTVANGVFTHERNPSATLTYGQVVQQVSAWEIPEEPPALKSPSEFRYIGKPLPRVDLPDKLIGKAVYGYDARLPDMLYGAIARPPTISATLRRAAPGEAPQQPGVVQAVIADDFAGVVAESRVAAYRGVTALDLEWDTGKQWQQSDIETLITVGTGSGAVIQATGNAESELRSGSVISAEYRTPMAAHAHLEAQAALVDVQPDKVRVWVSTQFPTQVQSAVAETLGREAETVEVIPTFLGGGFGRKSGIEPAVEAARLAQAAGRPVHVGWNRLEDMRYGYLRPPTHHIMRATLNADGKIQAIEHQQASGHVANNFIPGFLSAVLGSDFGAWRGALIPYVAPHVRTVAWHNDLPLRTGWWRGLGLLANIFAIESFIDELAHSVGADPLQFRLDHLPNDERGARFRKVLETVAQNAGWSEPLPEGRARGLACCIDATTVVAQVAEVSVVDEAIRVHRVTAVVDPGLVVNPDGATAQTEGSIVMGLSSTLLEEITVEDGRIVEANFDRYPLLTIKDTPDIAVTLLESGNQPFGMGEPPIGPIAAAVANAVFALTGARLRRLPLDLAESR